MNNRSKLGGSGYYRIMLSNILLKKVDRSAIVKVYRQCDSILIAPLSLLC